MSYNGAGSRNTFGWHGARVSRRGDDYTIGQGKKHFHHLGDGFVAHHSVYEPDSAVLVKSAYVAGQSASPGGVVCAVENYFRLLGHSLEPARPPRARYSFSGNS